MYRITNRCNLRCKYCLLWKDKYPEATTEEAFRIIDQLKKANVMYMTFSGGEPTLRKDLATISKYAIQKGIFTTLNTNGVLIDRRRAYDYITSFDVISVSIDGFEQTHNMLRGNNSYKRAIQGLENLIKIKNGIHKGARIGINTIIHPENLDEIIPLFEKYKDDIDFVAFQPVSPPMPIDFKKLDKLIRDLLYFKKKNPSMLISPDYYIKYLHEYFNGKPMKICGAGRDFALVNSDGSLLACPFIYGPYREHLKLGNLLEEDILTILQSKRTHDVLKKLKNCKGCMNEWSLIRLYFDDPLSILPRITREFISKRT